MSHLPITLPSYFDPQREAAAWDDVLDRADEVKTVVLNPASGPSPERQEAYARLVARLRAARVTVVGYVDTDYGRRDVRLVESEVRAYRDWYAVDGVFFDQVASDFAGLDACERYVRDARGLGCRSVVLNPGVYPHPAYAALANVLVTFDGTAQAHAQVRVPGWVRDLPAKRFCHLVYDASTAQTEDVLRRLQRAHVGSAYVTDHAGANPWDRLPSAWNRAVVAA